MVADEVRKLAERSSKATREIAALIKGIQEEANRATAVAASGMQAIEAGAGRSEESSTLLERIGKAVSQIDGLMQRVTIASHAQTSITRNIEEAVAQIHLVARTLNETASEQALAGETVAQATSRLDRLAQQVSEAVSMQQGAIQETIAVDQEGVAVAKQAAQASEAITHELDRLYQKAEGLETVIAAFSTTGAERTQRVPALQEARP